MLPSNLCVSIYPVTMTTAISTQALYNAHPHLSYINLHGINDYDNHQTTQ